MSVVDNPWSALRRYTPAHVGIGRDGVSLPTAVHLAFQVAHAQARDAVHDPLDVDRLCHELQACGVSTLRLHSAARTRAEYLQRPDRGRVVDDASQRVLDLQGAQYRADAWDLAVVVADGLSSRAAQRHAPSLLTALLTTLRENGDTWSLAPVCVVEQGRVAVGDAIGEALGARLVLVLVGERPGLSSPDSLGAYLTWSPRHGRTDAERNCVSNIRPEGLSYADAAPRLAALLRDARRRQVSGVTLKDERDVLPGLVASPAFLLER